VVTVRLFGGIGNQMFQYAAARRLAVVRGVALRLDLSAFGGEEKLRQFELHCFRVAGEILAAGTETSRPKSRVVRLVHSRLMGKLRSHYRGVYIKERSFHFDPEILNLQDNVYLDGYWQSEKYFKDIEATIRQDFKFTSDPGQLTMELAARITESESVSLHIRRGDYVTNRKTNEVHGTCSLDYYGRTTERLASRVRNPHFYVFSDDSQWSADHLKLPWPTTFVAGNGGERAYEDMRLMSLCKHHIIANSSFSWWGAWLSENPGKIVYAPARWFAGNKADTKDLLPETWRRI
jgi:hypothetical protein